MGGRSAKNDATYADVQKAKVRSNGAAASDPLGLQVNGRYAGIYRVHLGLHQHERVAWTGKQCCVLLTQR